MLAENLIVLRNIKGMSQEQIAEVIGISDSLMRNGNREKQSLTLNINTTPNQEAGKGSSLMR